MLRQRKENFLSHKSKISVIYVKRLDLQIAKSEIVNTTKDWSTYLVSDENIDTTMEALRMSFVGE